MGSSVVLSMLLCLQKERCLFVIGIIIRFKCLLLGQFKRKWEVKGMQMDHFVISLVLPSQMKEMFLLLIKVVTAFMSSMSMGSFCKHWEVKGMELDT